MSGSKCEIDIDGVEVDDMHNINILFVFENLEYKPVLYYKGKRVTKYWTISLISHQPIDKQGCSA